jgi:hypothetical protein
MLSDLSNTPFVDVRRRVRFVANDQGVFALVVKLSARTFIGVDDLVTQAFQESLELIPLDAGVDRLLLDLLKGLVVSRHGQPYQGGYCN